MSSEELKRLKLSEIFFNNDLYRIPIYQRNFAWGEKEILELLLDIYNQYKKYKNNEESNYYIGSLVISHKENNNIYDVIDGQQRLTIINLIYIYLIKESLLPDKFKEFKITIYFEIRDEINKYLNKKLKKEEINKSDITEENGLQSFEYALNIINNFFNEYFKENEDSKKKDYASFLFENVEIIRIMLPKDTDLIEYFEIMNTRGEQLELHDILKARLLDSISKNNEEIEKYSYIWEIVSDFSIYPSYKLDIDNIKDIINNKKSIFEKINYKLSNISYKYKLNEIFNEIEDKDTISAEIKEDEKAEQDEKFKSIIDFPNFLLIALKLCLDNEKISLNSQSLLVHFNDYLIKNNDSPVSPVSFIEELFKYRLIFDNYIIKQDNKKENNEKYKIQSYYKNKNNEQYYVNTITHQLEEDEAENDSKKLLEYFIIHLQTILEILSPTKQNKTWLYEALDSLINDEKNRLFSLTNSLWRSLRKNVSDLDFDNLCYPYISRKLFYYIDFLILLEFKLNQNYFKNDYFKNDESKFNNFKKITNDFEFSSVDSIEHIYSQGQAKSRELDNNILNGIGNLCLISKSQNTSLRDDSFESKKTYYFTKERTFTRKYSLKQALVFCKYDNWYEDDIKNHREEIKNLLDKYENENDLYSIIGKIRNEY